MSEPARLEAVEFKLAHMEHTLGVLSDVIARQQREIDSAHERLKHLAERLAGFESPHSDARGDDAGASAFEKPPHY
jgi:uncharacterized coiled-coil protein SlyX